ncbi:MAG: hypothetical protein UZ14_CFX002001120 [Chloroflexi bacterium OLB14]|nr:MAG: hypothetical protein UZ14_CFX002001120 [Chloroflexi bacterium OLB14]
MLFTDTAFVGINLNSSNKHFIYTLLDKNLNLVALGQGDLGDISALVAGQQMATVAINSPANVSHGLVAEKISITKKAKKTEFRLAEYQLQKHGIKILGTPSDEQKCSSSLRMGFLLYRKLEEMGFKKYTNESPPYQYLETQPHASFCCLAGGVPLSKSTIEGRIQRQLILYEHGVRIKDPMDFFEEITRHKMMKGIWPYELLYTPEQLNALVAAYTAWLVVNKPDQTLSIGNEQEGKIFLPVSELKEKY